MKNNCCGKCLTDKNLAYKKGVVAVICSNPTCSCHLRLTNNQKAGWEVKLLNWLKSELTDDSKFEKICELVEAELAAAREEERERLAGEIKNLDIEWNRTGLGRNIEEIVRHGVIMDILALLKTNPS